MGQNVVLENKALAVEDGKIIAIVDQSQSDYIKRLGALMVILVNKDPRGKPFCFAELTS